MKRTVIGVFDHFQNAERVLSELAAAGFPHDRVSLITPDEKRRPGSPPLRPSPHHPTDHDELTKRVGTGAAAGGLGGFLLALAAMAIPGVGPVLAAGPLITGLGGASLGAAAGGLAGALSSAGIAQEDAHFYAEALRRGSSIVSVDTEDPDTTKAVDIMNRFGAVDIDKRYVEYRKRGFNRFDYGQPPLTRDEVITEREHLAQSSPISQDQDSTFSVHQPGANGGVRVVTQIQPGTQPPRSDDLSPWSEPPRSP